ncbi:hypothetical protein EW146_g9716 [Bondarzewia mesenterica]|uniref:Cytochrome P450 n=1 Tax=Bondarzewia mesenterica TaxID=1095465 RepID=A0A4S4L474_9AGAM|nr:hypothetical protein EW146_g9716 [Bondarzewia mesenterica]
MEFSHIVLVLGLTSWLVLPAVLRFLRRPPVPPSHGALKKFAGEQPWAFYARCSKILDLLERRSSFQCKPRWPMAELLGRQHNVGFQYYGDRLKKSRRILHASLSVNSVSATWHGLLDAQSAKLVQSFLISPQTFYDDVQSNVQTLVVRFTYGHVPDPDYINLATKVMHETGIALQPGKWLINSIPALARVPVWMPGAGFQRWAKEARDSFLDMTRTPFCKVKEEIAHGHPEDSFVQQAFANLPDMHTSEDEDIVMCAAGSLFSGKRPLLQRETQTGRPISAGTDTLAGSILTFIVLIARHPEAQERAYQEIISVVGADRLPGLEDRHSLPFVDTVIQESHRYNPAIPLVTHSNTEEDEYIGLRIPKKTWIMANVWAMLHDESVYPDPDNFVPERFASGSVQPDPRRLLYGFGRRRCPGLHFANAFVYLVAVRVLFLFEIILEAQGGNPCPPALKFKTGLVPAPKRSRCMFRPRPHAAEVLGHVRV